METNSAASAALDRAFARAERLASLNRDKSWRAALKEKELEASRALEASKMKRRLKQVLRNARRSRKRREAAERRLAESEKEGSTSEKIEISNVVLTKVIPVDRKSVV